MFRMREHFRDYRYRPPRDDPDAGQGSMKLYARFARDYLWAHRWRVLLAVVLVSLNACSFYLMAYYMRVVVDDVLVVATAPDRQAVDAFGVVDEPVRGDRRPAATAPPRRGGISEEQMADSAARRPAGAMRRLLTLFALYVATIVALNAAQRLAERQRIRLSRELAGNLREDLHRKILQLSRSYHERHTPGRLMARILSDVDIVQKHMLNTILSGGSQIVMFLVGLSLLLALEWRMAAMAGLAMIPYALIYRRGYLRIRPLNRELRHTNACMYGLGSQKLDAIKAILAYCREKRELLNFHRLCACLLRDSLLQQWYSGRLTRAAMILTSVTSSLIFLYGTRLVMGSRMTLGTMMYVYGIAASLFMPVLTLTQLSVIATVLLVTMQRLVHILDQVPQVRDGPGAVEFPAPVRRGIDLRNVVFRYSEAGEPVLKDISLQIAVGSWVCIMGASGAGKSTLLHLLARLYEPVSGEMTVDGIPFGNIKLLSLRRRLALVPQEAQIFQGTVRDNITYGWPGAEPSAIIAAARAAECHDFIMDLPVQYETTIGERGASLSGGQRQRISLARALLTDPEVLLLDDCTSALDAATEQRVQETLARQLVNRTAVIVSQRVSMARRCHRICVLGDGILCEQGTHKELLALDGFYARLHRQQTA